MKDETSEKWTVRASRCFLAPHGLAPTTWKFQEQEAEASATIIAKVPDVPSDVLHWIKNQQSRVATGEHRALVGPPRSNVSAFYKSRGETGHFVGWNTEIGFASVFVCPETGLMTCSLYTPPYGPKKCNKRHRDTKTKKEHMWYTSKDDAENAAASLALKAIDLRKRNYKGSSETRAKAIAALLEDYHHPNFDCPNFSIDDQMSSLPMIPASTMSRINHLRETIRKQKLERPSSAPGGKMNTLQASEERLDLSRLTPNEKKRPPMVETSNLAPGKKKRVMTQPRITFASPDRIL